MTGFPGTGNPESESLFNFKTISYLFTRKSSYLEQSLICINSCKCSLHPKQITPKKHSCTVCTHLSDFTPHCIVIQVVTEENHKILSGYNPVTVFYIHLHSNRFIFFKDPFFDSFEIYFSQFLTKHSRHLLRQWPHYRQHCLQM